MRVVVIGGTGHIGSWLTPALVEAGHSVVCVSRSQRAPYVPHDAWKQVERVSLDRPLAEQASTFGAEIRALNADAVIDLTCYTQESAEQITDAIRGHVAHFLHCGTIWVHGPAIEVPTREEDARATFGDYGLRKAAIEEYLLQQHVTRGFPATIVHPGHLVGPGWVPLNPAGNFNPEVFIALAKGEEILLPNLGRETLHHVHVADVSQVFVKALQSPANAIGQSFHAVSPAALTTAGYAESAAEWFGHKAKIRLLPWDEWRASASPKDAAFTWDHIVRSPNCSIEKARRLLGYEPAYKSLAAIRESLVWLGSRGTIPSLTSLIQP